MTHNPGGIRRDAEQAVRTHFMSKMDEKTSSALSTAMYDLHYGPGAYGAEMSYTEAIKLLRDWSSTELHDVYYDVQCGDVLDYSDPQSWEDEDGTVFVDDRLVFDVSACRRLIFGALIYDGGM